MKFIHITIIVTVVNFFNSSFGFAQSYSMTDFLKEYCNFLGYDTYVDNCAASGQKLKTILPNGENVSAYKFLYGELGSEFSYCREKGYDIEKAILNNGKSKRIDVYCVKNNNGKDTTRKKIRLIDLLYEDPNWYSKNGSLGAPLPPPPPPPPDDEPIDTTDTSDDNIILNWNWRDKDNKNYVGIIHSQGYNECWIYSALGLAESSYFIANNMYDIDVQYFSDCWIRNCLTEYYDLTDIDIHGVEGGKLDHSVVEAINYGGIVDYDDYYICTNSCVYGMLEESRTFFNGWGTIDNPTIGQMKTFILNDGPIVASCNSDLWGGYSEGIHIDNLGPVDQEGDDYELNHSVLIVGWGYDDEIGVYWLVQNSQGYEWGDNGIIKVSANSSYIRTKIAYLKKYNSIVQVNGPQITCESGADYQLLFNPGNGDEGWLFTWSLTPANSGTITDRFTDHPTVSANSNNYSGWVTLKCVADAHPSYEMVFTKEIWLGNPTYPQILGPLIIDCNQSYYYNVDWEYDIFDLLWSVSPGSCFNIVTELIDDRLIEIYANTSGEGFLNIELTGDCGAQPITSSLYIQAYCYQPLYYPNPATTELTVDMTEFEGDGNEEELSEQYSITIIGSDNRMYANELKKGKKEKYSISNIPEGLATISVNYKNKNYSSKLMIKR